MSSIPFFDCNAYLGLPVDRQVRPVFDTVDFVSAMRAEGAARALVWHVAQYEYSPSAGNQMLADEIAPYEELAGCWAILPDAANELPPPEDLFAQMKASRMAALRAFPATHQFLLDKSYCGKLLAAASERRVPLLLSLRRGADYATVQALLTQYPDLVCIMCDHSEWALDRQVVTLMDRFPTLCIDTTFFGLHGMVKTVCGRFGANRVLFGSGFPEVSPAPTVYEIQHADLPEADRRAIAGGNLERILSEARL